MRILVDRAIYRGFAMSQAGTPSVIKPYAGQLQDQDEKAQYVVVCCGRIATAMRSAASGGGPWGMP